MVFSMGTHNHLLQGNTLTQIPSRYIFYDTETEGEEYIPDNFTDNLISVERHKLKLGTAVFYQKEMGKNKEKEEWLTFRTITEFWDWVEKHIRPRQKVYLIAHNQHFDFLIMNGFNELADRCWTKRKEIRDNGIWITKFKKRSMTLEVLDTFNWFKYSLKQLGEKMDIEKMNINFSESSDEQLIEYCKQDVRIIKKALLTWVQFIKDYDLGNFSPTLASQAFSAYTHRFMNYPIMIHGNKLATILERNSYRGGRNECFYLGEAENIHVLDFNSLYPSVMQDNLFPSKLISVYKDISVQKMEELLKTVSIIADCVINIDTPAIAYKSEKLIFPVGKFRVSLTTPEIEWVLENGSIECVNSLATYKSENIFYQYVVDMYNMRLKFQKEENFIYENIVKILLNSLYGKFGQRIRKTEVVGNCPADIILIEHCVDADINQRYTLSYYGGKIIKTSLNQEESINSFPAISSHVTAFARMKLFHAIEKAGFENVYYVDTDSLFVNDAGYKNLKSLISQTELGKLKLEYSSKYLNIHGCKDYEVDDKIKIKGIKKDAVKIDENTYQQIKFCKFASMLRKGNIESVDIETIIKNLKRNYDKGIVLDNGRVEPFELDY